MNVFLDSSALVKRYVAEPDRERLLEILSGATQLGLSVLAPPEVISALCRRRREGTLSAAGYSASKRELFANVADARLVAVSESVIATAVSLMERWPLRSADALHVASAAAWSCDLFVSADDRQVRAARSHGLSVERLSA